MNLVAKEGPLVNVRDGALVLSRNTGAFEELRPWAIEIDPFDVEDQANALERALELPREDRQRRLEGSVNGYAGTISTRGRRPSWPRSSAPVRCADDPRAGRSYVLSCVRCA